MILAVLTPAVVVFTYAAPLWAEEETKHKFGFNPESFEVKFYIQPRYTLDLTGDTEVDHFFGVRRSRIYLTSQVTPNIKGRIQFGTRPDSLKPLDVYFDWKFKVQDKKPLSVRVGQFKKPFSYQEFVMASNNLNLIDRTVANAFLAGQLFASERDQGAMLTVDLWEYDVPSNIYLSVMNGNGPGKKTDENTGKQFIGRADVTPVAGLTLGGDIAANRLGSADSAATAIVWGGEFVYEKKGFQVVSEVFGGDNTEASGVDLSMESTIPTFLAWYAEAIYRSSSGWEPALRFESFDPNTDTDSDDFTVFQGAVGYSFSKNFRWQVEFTHTEFSDDAEESLDTLVTQWTVRL
jgi:hypothetical protein